MDKNRLRDLIISIIMFVISGLYFLNITTLTPPADIFPKFVIFIFTILALFLLAKVIFMKSKYKKEEEEEQEEERINNLRRWIGIGSLIIYVIIMPVVGFYVSSGVFIILISGYLMGKNPLKPGILQVIIPVITMAVLYFAFSEFLRVPVPKGFLF